jgi:hypothetical protein
MLGWPQYCLLISSMQLSRSLERHSQPRRSCTAGTAPKEDRYQLPAELSINNNDGLPITLGQFMPDTHAYLNRPEVMDVINEVNVLS